MNISTAHWHLLLNHFPIVLSITGSVFLLLSFLFKKQHLQFAGLLLLIFAALSAYPAFRTGKAAEEPIEHLDGIDHELIHNHEDVASLGLKIMFATGALALISLVVLSMKKKATNIFLLLTLLAGLGSAGYMSYVGYTGGEVRHTEIQGDFWEKPRQEKTSLPPGEEVE
jgi:uncharacterized membrane protein